MIWRIGLLIAALAMPALVEAATYYASPSGGGAASCVDNAANVCTLPRAITVSSAGDTIIPACGTYDLGSSALALNKNVTLEPVTVGCAIVTTTNSTSTVSITASNDANVLTLGSLDLRNTGGSGQIVQIVSVAYDATVQLVRTIIPAGAVNRHIQDAWVRGTVKFTNITLGGTIGTQAGIYSVTTPTSAKKVEVSGGAYVLTASASNTPAIWIERAASVSVSEWVHVTGAVVNVTVPAALGTNALGIGIRLHRITTGTNLSGVSEDPIIELNTVTVSTPGATGVDALGIVNSSTDATAVADRTIIRDNTVTCYGPATRCISIGTDGSTAFNAANAQIYRNTVSSSYYDGTSTPHGISIGRVTGGVAWGNTVIGFAVGILTAINQGAVVSGNVVAGAYYAPLFSKGSGSTTVPIFTNNTVIMDDALFGAKFGNYGCLAAASQGATNNAGVSFRNNICYVRGGAGWKYVVVDASQVASFDTNDYYSVPTLSTPWSYQGSTYASLGLWNAAATVGTEISVNPYFFADNNYRLSGTSTLRNAGTWASIGCKDFRGRPCFVPPDIGAYQSSSGDPAGARVLR